MQFPEKTTGQAAQAVAPRQEAVMGQAIPRQQPAVVLRSHFNQLRALLAVAAIAVAGLTVAVVILANDSDEVSSTSAAKPVEEIRYGGFNSATGRPESAPLPQLEHPLQSRIEGTRYDGGPEEGTRGIVPAPQPSVSPETEIKNEAGTAAAIGQSSGGTEFRGSKSSEYGTSQYRFAQPQPGTELDEEAQEARRTDPHGPASALP
jgi:hypothetical protein